jgi:ABC-type multidrug transport system ATPase subunit
VGEGGASLSGGEQQRISIARCILKDAPVIILDEATASVDADNESYIQQAIGELCKGKTLLVIAHRLNTIQNADQILVVADGGIAQRGTHEDLLQKDGIYRQLWRPAKTAADGAERRNRRETADPSMRFARRIFARDAAWGVFALGQASGESCANGHAFHSSHHTLIQVQGVAALETSGAAVFFHWETRQRRHLPLA